MKQQESSNECFAISFVSTFQFSDFSISEFRLKERKKRVDYFLLRTALDLRATCKWTSTSDSALMSTCGSTLISCSSLTRLTAKDEALSNPSSANANGWLEVVDDADEIGAVDEEDDADDADSTGETDCTKGTGAVGSSTSITWIPECECGEL